MSGYRDADETDSDSNPDIESRAVQKHQRRRRAIKILGKSLVAIGSCLCLLGVVDFVSVRPWDPESASLEEAVPTAETASDIWTNPMDTIRDGMGMGRKRKKLDEEEETQPEQRAPGNPGQVVVAEDLDPVNIGYEVVRELDGKQGLLQRGPFGGYYVEGMASHLQLLRGIRLGEWTFASESAENKQHTGHLMKVYHQTSPAICELIMKDNFRLGHGGWCGDAIYFALTPESTRTKAITKGSHDGCMIEATVDIGNVNRIRKLHTCQNYDATKNENDGYDSVIFNPGDGPEVVLYDAKRVVAKTILPYNKVWLVPALRGHHYT